MSELRHDPLEDRWILVAPERARRPRFVRDDPVLDPDPGTCPFCPGNEAHTRPALAVVAAGDEGPRYRRVDAEEAGWWVRVVPNRYPMLTVEPTLSSFGEGLEQGFSGVGAHEVVIETPRHDVDLDELGVEALAAIVVTWRERIRDLHRDRRLVQVQVFRNHGALAGATVPHPHSQLCALPIVPARLARQRRRMDEEFADSGRRLLDRLWEESGDGAGRVLLDRDGVAVFAPWASPNRYELIVVMPGASPDFCGITDEECRALASALGEAYRRQRRLLGDPPMNLGLFVEPNPGVEKVGPGFRWHLRLLPRLGPTAGFEWMGEVLVNTTLPEDAVSQLLSVDLDAS